MGIKKVLKNAQAEELKNYHKRHTDSVIFRYLFQFLNPYRKDVYILIILLLITSLTGLTYPIGMIFILRVVETKQIGQLLIIGLILGGLMFLNFFTKKSYQLNIKYIRKLYNYLQTIK